MATNVMVQVYETSLCSPGMNETVKIDVKINRKTVLLLNSIIERGLAVKDGEQGQGLPELIPKDIPELIKIKRNCTCKVPLIPAKEPEA